MSRGHRVEAERKLRDRNKAYERIAKSARELLLARRKYLTLLLTPVASRLDDAQEVVNHHLKALEKSVKAAEDAKLFS